jgi:hypothetical protein
VLPTALTQEEHVGVAAGSQEGRSRHVVGEKGVERDGRAVDQHFDPADEVGRGDMISPISPIPTPSLKSAIAR